MMPSETTKPAVLPPLRVDIPEGQAKQTHYQTGEGQDEFVVERYGQKRIVAVFAPLAQQFRKDQLRAGAIPLSVHEGGQHLRLAAEAGQRGGLRFGTFEAVDHAIIEHDVAFAAFAVLDEAAAFGQHQHIVFGRALGIEKYVAPLPVGADLAKVEGVVGQIAIEGAGFDAGDALRYHHLVHQLAEPVIGLRSQVHDQP